MDKNTRPEHAALNGLIRRWDDPFWKEWYPPNGFKCRCTVRSLSRAYLEAHNINVEKIGKGMPDMKEIAKNNKDNEAFDNYISQKLNSFDKKGKLYFEPDTGFKNNVGEDLYNWVKIKNREIGRESWESVSKNKVQLKNELKDTKPEEFKQEVHLFEAKGKDAIKEGSNFLKDELKDVMKDGVILDKFEMPVYFDIDRFVRHIGEKQHERLKYILLVKKLLKDPDAVITDVMVATGKLKIRGMTKIPKKYVKKIKVGGKDYFVCLVTNFSKASPDYTGWTMFLEQKELNGMLIYRK